MKHLFLSLAFGLLAVAPVFAQKNEEAIKKVCLAETQAWLDQDVEAWAATHLQSDQDVLTWNNSDGTCGQLRRRRLVLRQRQADAAPEPARDLLEGHRGW